MSTVTSRAPFALAEQPSHTALLAKYFRGFGDPTRLRILRLLDEVGPLSVSAIMARVGAPQATVSTHLACLRWCGFVTARREDRFVIYALADARVRQLIEIAESLLADNAEHVGCCPTIDHSRPR